LAQSLDASSETVRERSGGSGRLGHETVLHQHPDPARRVALDHLRFIIDRQILIWHLVTEYGIEDAKHLVRQGHDGFFCPFRTVKAMNLSRKAQ